MDVAILYSGGKDSTYAIEYCQNKNWNIKYLISIKPSRKDCYLYHFATVELTKELSKILGYKHFYLNCDIADPKKEALIVKDLVQEQQKMNKVDALVLGGIGLQETQLKLGILVNFRNKYIKPVRIVRIDTFNKAKFSKH